MFVVDMKGIAKIRLGYWMTRVVAAMVVFGLIGHSQTAYAQSCSISASGGNYGTISLLSGASTDTTATLAVSCTGLSLFTVRLCVEVGPGANVNGSGNRIMVNGANTLRHEAYTSAARTTIWGAWGATGAAYIPQPFGITYDLPLNLFGSGSVNLPIYLRILANQQTTVPGNYSWSASTTPGIRYGYAALAACPTGLFTRTTAALSTATVSASCQVSATSLNFGSQGSLSSVIDANGSVSVTCTNGTPYQVAMNFGTGIGAGPVNNRRMTGPSGTQANYTVFRDAARTQEWGDSLGVSTKDSTGTGAVQIFPAYGRVLAQATPIQGNYSDTVIVTVNY